MNLQNKHFECISSSISLNRRDWQRMNKQPYCEEREGARQISSDIPNEDKRKYFELIYQGITENMPIEAKHNRLEVSVAGMDPHRKCT